MQQPTNKCNCNCYCHKEGTFQEEDGVSSTHAPSDCQCHQPNKQGWEEVFDEKFQDSVIGTDDVPAITSGKFVTSTDDIKTFISTLLKEHDTKLIETLLMERKTVKDGMNILETHEDIFQNTINHGYNNALQDAVNIIKGV